MNEILYFLHIPKTAGFNLINLLKDNFKKDKVYPHAGYHELFQKNNLNFDSYDFIHGHYTVSLLKNIKNPVKTITILRNPISRTISAYNMFMRELEENFEFSKFKKTSIENALKNQSWLFSDQQTKHLGWDSNIIEYPKEKIPKKFSIEAWQEFYQNVNMDKLFENACENLKKLYLFGFTEKIDEFVQKLYDKMNWNKKNNLSKKYDDKNYAFKESSLTLNLKKEIEKLNQYDIKLYDYALDLYKNLS